jgi:hypothetical protein
MSLIVTESRIVCDDSRCGRSTRLPIIARPNQTKVPDDNSARSTASGWLFVRSQYDERHYCPDCSRDHLP